MDEAEREEIIRRNREFPIYVWSYKAGEEYIRAGLEALDHLLSRLRMEEYFPVRYFGERFSNGEWGSAEYYFNHPEVKKRRNEVGELQFCSTDIHNLCRIEPWQKQNPHIEFLMTGVDLYAGEGTNFVYGSTRPLVYIKEHPFVYPFPGTIVSFRRMKMWYRNPVEIFSLLAVHELGHLFGLPAEGRNDTEEVLGLHCRRADCAMSQVNVERDIIFPDGGTQRRFIGAEETYNHVENRRRRTGEYFCSECLKDLRRSRDVLLNSLFTES